MSLFNFNPIRYIREWFFEDVSSKDRLVKTHKPTQTTYQKLVNSIPFIRDRKDAAKAYTNNPTTLGIQGLVVMNTCDQVEHRDNKVVVNNSRVEDVDVNNDKYSFAVSASNLPEVLTDLSSSLDAQTNINSQTEDSPYWEFENNINFPDLNQYRCVSVEEVFDTNNCRTLWKPKIANQFINWIYEGLKFVLNHPFLLNKSEWNTLDADSLVRMYDNGNTQVYSFPANYDNSGINKGKIIIKHHKSINDTVAQVNFFIELYTEDFPDSNGQITFIRFEIPRKISPTQTICFMRGKSYTNSGANWLDEFVGEVTTSLTMSNTCLVEIKNIRKDLDGPTPNNDYSLSPTAYMRIEGQIILHVIQ